MTREHFETLLSDLYDIYNPGKKSDVSGLLDKYNGQEFDAVYQLLFKYNYPRSPLYNPELASPKFVKLLIDSYSSERRILKEKDFLLKNYNQNVKFEGMVEEKVSSVKSEITKDINDKMAQSVESIISGYEQKISTLKDALDEKMKAIEETVRSYQNQIPEIMKSAVPADPENIEIKLNILWSEHEINIPSNLKYCAAGDRVITTDNNGNVIGLEIKDIYWDCVSVPGKLVKEVTIDKVSSAF
jgi:hypothetical protein